MFTSLMMPQLRVYTIVFVGIYESYRDKPKEAFDCKCNIFVFALITERNKVKFLTVKEARYSKTVRYLAIGCSKTYRFIDGEALYAKLERASSTSQLSRTTSELRSDEANDSATSQAESSKRKQRHSSWRDSPWRTKTKGKTSRNERASILDQSRLRIRSDSILVDRPIG